PGRPLVHPLGAIAARTTFSLGEASTSATFRCPATLMSMPVETSDCGSRSTTRVRRPLAKAAEARPSVTVVFPTPPLRELTLRTCTTRNHTFTILKERNTSRLRVGSTASRPRKTAGSLKGPPFVLEDPCCKPRRNRHSCLSGSVRARRQDRGGLSA